MHGQPDYQAGRLVAYAADIGFDALRKANKECWANLWKGRIRLVGASKTWQAMADAAFFYLMSSAHSSSPSSTSIFGLATWHDYHYYYGHVMWDIETFCVPPLVFLQPDAAGAMLDYRVRNLEFSAWQCAPHGAPRTPVSLGRCALLGAGGRANPGHRGLARGPRFTGYRPRVCSLRQCDRRRHLFARKSVACPVGRSRMD